MSIGKKKLIFIAAIHVKIIFKFHDFVIECYKKFCTAKGSTRVPRVHLMNHAQYVSSDLTG